MEESGVTGVQESRVQEAGVQEAGVQEAGASSANGAELLSGENSSRLQTKSSLVSF